MTFEELKDQLNEPTFVLIGNRRFNIQDTCRCRGCGSLADPNLVDDQGEADECDGCQEADKMLKNIQKWDN